MKFAHNPVLDNHIFIPDVEAHAWGDGRIYLYGSFDIQGSTNYCSDVYHVYSSEDMVHWTDHGQSFSLADTAWARDCAALYAPDCAYKDGWYYLYYCVPDGRCGVAKSQSPTGPFEDVGPIAGDWGIDPAVLVDDYSLSKKLRQSDKKGFPYITGIGSHIYMYNLVERELTDKPAKCRKCLPQLA